MSSCDCVYVDVDQYDGPDEDYLETINISKDRCFCEECGEVIHPGEPYELVRGTWSWGEKTVRTCLDCKDVIDNFFCGGYCFGRVWEDLGNHIQEMDGDISSDCLCALRPRARAMVCEIIEEVWAEMDEEEEDDLC